MTFKLPLKEESNGKVEMKNRMQKIHMSDRIGF